MFKRGLGLPHSGNRLVDLDHWDMHGGRGMHRADPADSQRKLSGRLLIRAGVHSSTGADVLR
jgi:hypothetical protein